MTTAATNTAHRIAVIPGDHIGKEVVPEAIRVLEAAAPCCHRPFEFRTFDWGADHYLETGAVMPADGLKRLEENDAILLGAIGDAARVPDDVMSWGLVQKVRKGFDLWINLRPARLRPGVTSPLRNDKPFDVVVVRENTAGEYSGAGGRVHRGTPHEVAVQTSVFTRSTIERVARYAFDLASLRPRRRLTSITKSNALNHTMVLWDEVVEEVRAEYPDIRFDKVHIDAMVMHLMLRPDEYDVLLATNLFGDIVSDQAAALQGGIGLAAGANLNPDGGRPPMFEPIHGSAPDIAGKGIANPLATILAAAMMLDHLGEAEAARSVEGAVDVVLAGSVRTRDLGGLSATSDVGEAVVKAMLHRGLPM